ncbi:MAG: transposase [Desulfobacterales bacterium]|nr:transposase [Desulfobacterales bacterium]
MIHLKDHKQGELFDPWHFLSPKRRQLLDTSWPGLFKNEILPELPVSKLLPFFKEDFGRPTKELYTVLGTLVCQQTFDLTDNETCDQLAFNIQWHYAFNIPEESDAAKYMCPKTLWSMRKILVDNEMDHFLFESITKKLSEVFKVDTDQQRIDSVHIKSNMRRLGRIGIFVKAIHKFLKNLKRHHPDLFQSVDAELVEKYLPEKSLQCFSMVKPSESQQTLSSVSNDLFDLLIQFKAHPKAAGMHSYKQLSRILNEQCQVKKAEANPTVEVKPPKEVPSDSLQNPSDPDASYSGHKGQGYQVQIMETYTPSEEPAIKEGTLNLITHVDVQRAHESDASALVPAIESTTQNDLGPKEILADSHYNSDENRQQAEQADVEIVSPTMGRKNKTRISLSDFEISEKGVILSCPQAHAPVMVKKKKTRHTAAFDSTICSQCPEQDACPVKPGKKYHYLRYNEKESRIAKRRAYEQSDEFKDRYRWRAGVEATMSEYDRRTGAKKLRIRGFKSVRYCAVLKAIGINLLRAASIRRASYPGEKTAKAAELAQSQVIFIIKERFLSVLQYLKNLFNRQELFYGRMLINF